MRFRKATELDINRMMHIIRQAQSYFMENGINQWQNNYPNSEIIRHDILNQSGYVLINDNTVVGTVALYFNGEKSYENIQGEWISHQKYAVIHRIAVDTELKGFRLASVILNNIENICLEKEVYSIKVDTHEKNHSMQRWLQKNGFIYCGIIYLPDNSKRLAYEKILPRTTGA